MIVDCAIMSIPVNVTPPCCCMPLMTIAGALPADPRVDRDSTVADQETAPVVKIRAGRAVLNIETVINGEGQCVSLEEPVIADNSVIVGKARIGVCN